MAVTEADIAKWHRSQQQAALDAASAARFGYAAGCEDAQFVAIGWKKNADMHAEFAITLEANVARQFMLVDDSQFEALRLRRVGDEFAHRLATMLECALLDRPGSFDEACALLDEYRAACRAAAPEAPTFMGEPLIS